jgi:hypothetical protein
MFNDADETLREILLSDVPVDRTEVDITFERPTREWSSRLSKPTLNLFLFDIRERVDFRDDEWVITRTPDGRTVRSRGPRRVDLSYSVTAWTKEPDDEHRILGRVLACMYRQNQVGGEVLKGALASATVPVYVRCMPPDYLAKPADFWGVMDNELHASLTWVTTVPLDVFAPIAGPMVVTRELQYTATGTEGKETFVKVGGVVHQKGDRLAGIPSVRVQVVGTGYEVTTGDDGTFILPRVPAGEQTWRVEPPEGKPFERKVTVPSASYDIEI